MVEVFVATNLFPFRTTIISIAFLGFLPASLAFFPTAYRFRIGARPCSFSPATSACDRTRAPCFPIAPVAVHWAYFFFWCATFRSAALSEGRTIFTATLWWWVVAQPVTCLGATLFSTRYGTLTPLSPLTVTSIHWTFLRITFCSLH